MIVEDLELSEDLPERSEDLDYYNPLEEELSEEEEIPLFSSEDIKSKMSDDNHSGALKVRVPDAFTREKGKAQIFLRSIKQYIILEENKFKDGGGFSFSYCVGERYWLKISSDYLHRKICVPICV